MLNKFNDIADYYGCFSGNGWLKELHPESWDHPARVAFGLSERIYHEGLEKGWLKPGDTVLDPFCGVAGFGFHALVNGLNFAGMEIEQDYYSRARKNVDLWNDRYSGRLARWGQADIYLGDSRELTKYVKKADAVITSPTYSELTLHNPHPTAQVFFKDKSLFYDATENYGKAEGQTGNMKPDQYWQAQAQIVGEIEKIMSPGGYLIYVVKRYVRLKRMVEFPTQFAEFFHAHDYELVAWRKAWQYEENGKQIDLFGGVKVNSLDHRSFFRARHARNFPELAINWEDVLVVRKKKFNIRKAIHDLGFD